MSYTRQMDQPSLFEVRQFQRVIMNLFIDGFRREPVPSMARKILDDYELSQEEMHATLRAIADQIVIDEPSNEAA